jgi:hypothetical protein
MQLRNAARGPDAFVAGATPGGSNARRLRKQNATSRQPPAASYRYANPRRISPSLGGVRANDEQPLKTAMDNLTFDLLDVAIDVPALADCLVTQKVKLTRRTDPELGLELLLFSLPVGPHRMRWLFRANPLTGRVTCSGGMTKTLYGHNVWVFGDEAMQLDAITRIMAQGLRSIVGLTLSRDAGIEVKRVELTRHHELPDGVGKAEALRRLDQMLMTLLPGRYSNEGRNHDAAGTTRIGKTKSSRIFRSYDPASKFGRRPAHVSQIIWDELCQACARHLRLEFMFNKRELQAAGLDAVTAWEDAALVERLLESRYRRFGLSVAFRADQQGLTPKAIWDKHPSFVEPARYFFTDGVRGFGSNPRNGGNARFKRFMLDHGYCVDVPFARHGFLVHGLHEVLRHERAAELPPRLAVNQELFGRWWV